MTLARFPAKLMVFAIGQHRKARIMKHKACWFAVALALVPAAMPGGGRAFAQDPQIWIDHNIATGQAAVLDHMNREAAKKAHRDAGLPPPDFKAAERRVRSTRATAPKQMSPAQRVRNCGIIRENLHRLDDRQMAIYRRGCR